MGSALPGGDILSSCSSGPGGFPTGCVFGHFTASNEGKTVFDVYDIGQKLGSGNFGEVRACSRRKQCLSDLDRDLAVKIIDLESAVVKAAEAYKATREEVTIMEGVHHPNVVELVDMFEDKRFLYVIMERVLGGELFVAISDGRAEVIEEDVARIGRQLLRATEYLHSIGIVHRDIKAQNILLTEPPVVPGRVLQSAAVKLIDFGLAARVSLDCLWGETPLNLTCGTPAMCAPEIWSTQKTALQEWKEHFGSTYGSKVDVWAIGVVLYMVLLGRLPFAEKTVARLAVNICNPKTKPSFTPRQCDYKVTQGCKVFLSSLLEKDPARRPTAAKAARDPWVNPGDAGVHSWHAGRARGMSMAPIPLEVLEEAAVEARAALALCRELRPEPEELAARSAAFEAARAEAEEGGAPHQSGLREDEDSEGGLTAGSEEEEDEDEGEGREAGCSC